MRFWLELINPSIMKIIQADFNELDDLVALFDEYRVWYGAESHIQGARKFLAERFLHNESVVFMAYSDENEPLGFTQLYPKFSSVRMARLWILNDLFVTENARGLGVSIALINKAKDLVMKTGAAGLNLETQKTNVVGNHLYPRTDFVLEEEFVFYNWTNPFFEV
jgi:GNAT superfamily N-acetyltransferase